MAITYDPTLATDLSKVRFYISDTVDGSGPFPDDVNMSDAEITALLTIEGSVDCAIAACFERLSAIWQSNPVFGVSEVGTTHGRVSEGFQKKADDYRKRCAGSVSLAVVGSSDTLREDSFTDGGTEYAG